MGAIQEQNVERLIDMDLDDAQLVKRLQRAAN
jgi:hypothetical protein